jgi:oligosaccharide repeat unit polymerase
VTAAWVAVAVLTLVFVWTVVALPPLHPAQLWLLPWAAATFLYSLRLLPYRPIATTTALLIVAASVSFVFFTRVGERIAERLQLPGFRHGRLGAASVPLAACIALSLAAVLVAAFLLETSARYGVKDTLLTSPRVRRAIGMGEFALTIKYVYAAYAATALSALAAARTSGRRTHVWAFLAAVSAGSIYFSTGRSTIVLATTVGITAYVLGRGITLSRRTFILGAAGVAVFTLAVFTVGGFLIGKTFANNPYLQDVPSVFRDYDAVSDLALPYEYASAPIAALDIQVENASAFGSTYGCAIFAEECDILQKVGVGSGGHERIRPFTREPLPWNTYTALDLPLLDGGLAFSIPMIALVGLFVGVLWARARAGSVFAISWYALVVPALLAAFTQFNFTAPYVLGALVMVVLFLAVAYGVMQRCASTTRTPRFRAILRRDHAA